MMKYHHMWCCLPFLFALLHAHPFRGPQRHIFGVEKTRQDVLYNDKGTVSGGDPELFAEHVFEPLEEINFGALFPSPNGRVSSEEDLDDLFVDEPRSLFDSSPNRKEDVLSDISLWMNAVLDSSDEFENDLEGARRRSNLVEDEFEEGNAGVAVRLTKNALLSVAQNITNFLVHDISRLSVSDITLKSMDLNITLHGIKTHSYVPPSVDLKVDGDTITVRASKGSVKLFGQYTAVYKTVRQGVVEAKMSGFDLDLKVKMIKSPLGSLNVEVAQCDAEVDHVHVDLIRHLLDQVTDDVRESLDELSTAAICKYLRSYAEKVNERLDRTMMPREIDIHTNVPQGQMQLDLRLSDRPELFADYVDIPVVGEFTRSSQRTPFKPHKLMKRIEDSKRMIYVYMSDFVVNSFFFQLEAIADWKSKLHRVPAIGSTLRLSCPQSEGCFGQYVENPEHYVENSGRMYGKALERPRVSLMDRGAHLSMNLSVDLTYQRKNELTPRTVVRFHTYLKLHIDSFTVLTNEIAEVEGERSYKVNASGGIDELKADNIEVFDDNWGFCRTMLPSIVQEHRPKLETVLRQNLHTVFSIGDGIIPAINSIDGLFRKRTLVLGLDIDMQTTISDFLGFADIFNY